MSFPGGTPASGPMAFLGVPQGQDRTGVPLHQDMTGVLPGQNGTPKLGLGYSPPLLGLVMLWVVFLLWFPTGWLSCSTSFPKNWHKRVDIINDSLPLVHWHFFKHYIIPRHVSYLNMGDNIVNCIILQRGWEQANLLTASAVVCFLLLVEYHRQLLLQLRKSSFF